MLVLYVLFFVCVFSESFVWRVVRVVCVACVVSFARVACVV